MREYGFDEFVQLARLNLRYDSKTGHIFWARDQRARKIAGKIAGSPSDDGYTCIKFKERLYKAHRLAWLLTHGEWPKKAD